MNIIKQIKRLFLRNRTTLTINCIGMTVGLCVVLLLSLFIKHELSYDRHFEHCDRIARLKTYWKNDQSINRLPLCTREAYDKIPNDIVGVESCVQIYRGGDRPVRLNNELRGDVSTLYVDANFLSFFERPIVESLDSNPFVDHSSVMITESTAKQIFGKEHNVVGERIRVAEKEYTVSAVIEDYPSTTHFSCDLFYSLQSDKSIAEMKSIEFFTYFLLSEGVDQANVLRNIEQSYTSMLHTWIPQYADKLSAGTDMLKDIHLFSDVSFDLSPTGNKNLVIVLSIVAFLIFFMAIFNSINLFALVGQNRTREIALKQISGATKRNITLQLLREALVLNLVSLILGCILAAIILPEFNVLTSRSIEFSRLWSPFSCLIMLSALLLSTLLSGVYPAFLLARENSISILKSEKMVMKGGKNRLSNGLLCAQLLVSCVVIFGLLSLNSQVNFLRTLSLGIDTQNVVQFNEFTKTLTENQTSIKNELESMSFVQSVALRNHSMGGGCSGQVVSFQGDFEEKGMSINEYRVHPGYAQFYNIPLVWGRYFSDSDLGKGEGFLINETTAKQLGVKPNDTRKLSFFGHKIEIIGVLEDFVYASAHEKVQPLFLSVYNHSISGIDIRFVSNPTPEMIKEVEKKLSAIDPNYVANYMSLDDVYQNQYRSESVMMKILMAACFVIISICLMGLFAILVFDIAKRVKEFGIRKVLGASIENIVLITSKKVLVLFGVVSIVLIPISVLLFKKLTSYYAFSTTFNPLFVVLAIVLPLILVILVVGSKAHGLIYKNPVEALRVD